MLIENHRKVTRAQLSCGFHRAAAGEISVPRWISFQYRGQTRLDEYGNSQIGAPGMKGSNGGCFENEIAERAEANDQYFRALWQAGKQG